MKGNEMVTFKKYKDKMLQSEKCNDKNESKLKLKDQNSV